MSYFFEASTHSARIDAVSVENSPFERRQDAAKSHSFFLRFVKVWHRGGGFPSRLCIHSSSFPFSSRRETNSRSVPPRRKRERRVALFTSVYRAHASSNLASLLSKKALEGAASTSLSWRPPRLGGGTAPGGERATSRILREGMKRR